MPIDILKYDRALLNQPNIVFCGRKSGNPELIGLGNPCPMVEDEAIALRAPAKPIANQLEALLTPAITNQENYYRQLGLRDRIRLIEIRSGKIFSRQASS